MYIGIHVKCPLCLSDLNSTWIFSKYFRKTLKFKISWKSLQWEPSCSMRTDGQTDTMKLTVDFRNFANAPTNDTSVKWATFNPVIPYHFSPMTCGTLLLDHPSYLQLSWKTTKSTHFTSAISTYFKVVWLKHRTVPQDIPFLSHSIPVTASSYSKVTQVTFEITSNWLPYYFSKLLRLTSTYHGLPQHSSDFLD